MEILFLGTSAAVPSKDHSTSCIALRSGSDIILLDCGEGSQRQLMLSPFSFMKIRAVLITHLHGDHVFGLPGLLQTMSLSNRADPLLICGPPGTACAIDAMMSVTEGETQYPVEVLEVSGGEELDVGGMSVRPYATDHGIASVGYVVQDRDRPGRLDAEKARALGITSGRDMARLKEGEPVGGVMPEDVVGPTIPGYRIAYSGDTRPCSTEDEAVRGADVIIHEATYMDSESQQAHEHFHTTARQAGEVARDAGARYLILTHISNRYDDRAAVADEARLVFPETHVAEDMQMYRISGAGLCADARLRGQISLSMSALVIRPMIFPFLDTSTAPLLLINEVTDDTGVLSDTTG